MTKQTLNHLKSNKDSGHNKKNLSVYTQICFLFLFLINVNHIISLLLSAFNYDNDPKIEKEVTKEIRPKNQFLSFN